MIISPFVKIAFTGSHNRGKTTLAKYLAQHFGYAYVPEYARILLQDKQNFLESFQERATLHREADEVFLSNAQQSFVADRVITDYLAYAALRQYDKFDRSKAAASTRYIVNYRPDIIFTLDELPADPEKEYDTSVSNEKSNVIVDHYMNFYLSQYAAAGTLVVHINGTDFETRKETAVREIKTLIAKKNQEATNG